jgi:hypothetical protein
MRPYSRLVWLLRDVRCTVLHRPWLRGAARLAFCHKCRRWL